MGWDKHYGYQLYQSDPSGNYSGWKATCIGNNSAVSEPTFLTSFLTFCKRIKSWIFLPNSCFCNFALPSWVLQCHNNFFIVLLYYEIQLHFADSNNQLHILFQAAISSLKQEYKEGEISLKDAQALAIKVLSKTLDMTKLTSEKGMQKNFLNSNKLKILSSKCLSWLESQWISDGKYAYR